MANTYSKYELKPFTNTYVDSGVKEISTILAQRYDKNKAKKDLIDQSLGSLDVMDGDMHLLENVKDRIKGDLKHISATGAWEDASLAIDEAVTTIKTDDGLLAAQKSMENRQAELEFIKKQTMEGKKVLDFGKSKAATHQSYTYNKETSKWEDNIYQAGAETRLDYEEKMGKLLKLIKADVSGVSKAKADGIAKGLYYTYSQSDEGQQDLRRLMELEYDQNIPEKERYAMAQRDIIGRIKGFTNQYIHSTGKGGSGAASSVALLDKYRNVSKAAMAVDYTAVNIADLHDKDSLFSTRLLDMQQSQMDAIKNGDMQKAKDIQEVYDNTLMSMVKSGKLSKEEAALVHRYEIDLWKGGKDKGGHDKAFGTFVKYLTDDRVTPDFYLSKDVEWGTLAAKTGGGYLGALGLGAGLTWAGATAAGALATAAAPFVAVGALGYLAYQGITSITDYGNVRDTLRDGADATDDGEGLWSAIGPDSEKKQLMDTVEDIAWMNDKLGTNYTEKDIPRLKLMAEQYYDYKVGRADGTSEKFNGDNIAEKFGEYEGDVFEGNSYTMSFNKEGNAASSNVNNIMSRHNVNMNNFRVLGVPTDSEKYGEYVNDENGEKINGPIKFQKLVAPSLIHNTPTRMVVTTPSGKTALVEAKQDSNAPGVFGIMESVANEMGLGQISLMEGVVEQLSDTPNATYSQVANAVMNSVVQIAQTDAMDSAQQEMVMKQTLRTLYFTIPEVNTSVEQKIKEYEGHVGRQITNQEANKLIDLYLFDPNTGLIVNDNVYR